MKKRNILETKIVKHYLNLSLNHFAENIKKKKKKPLQVLKSLFKACPLGQKQVSLPLTLIHWY